MLKSTESHGAWPAAVSISDPDLRSQKRIGGSARALLGPEQAARAAAAMTELSHVVFGELETSLRDIERLARERSEDAPQRIYLLAHGIRSVAGAFARERLGRVAGCICSYLETRLNGAAVDANTLTLLVIAARQTHKGDTDPLADELVEECEMLVAHANGGPYASATTSW